MAFFQLPNGVTQSQAMYQDRFGKLQEHLRQLALLFRKLRLLYERCVEMTTDLQEGPAEVWTNVEGYLKISAAFDKQASPKDFKKKKMMPYPVCVFCP